MQVCDNCEKNKAEFMRLKDGRVFCVVCITRKKVVS
jgi:uncharacterized Zn finger protein (UPF0148 family)